MKQKQLVLLVLMMTAALISGCNSDDDNENLRISGIATAGEPIESATVSLYTLDGQVIENFNDETQSQGTFLVSVPRSQVRNGYRVEVTGGVLAASGIPFTETLTAVVDHAVREERQLLHVGYASTVLAGYMDRHPEEDSRVAESTVAGFLNIPETQHLLTDLFFYEGHFSEDEFAGQAAQNGGLDIFVETLLDEMDAGDQVGRTFAPPPMVGSAKSAFVEGLIEGAGSEVGSRAAGWVLDSIFGESDTPQYPTDPAVLNAIQENGMAISNLRKEIEIFEANVNNKLRELLTQAEQNEYTILVTALADEIAMLQRQEGNLWFLCTHLDDPEDTDWKSYAEDLRNDLDVHELEDALRKFQRILGGADTSSAIDLWGFLQTRHAVNAKNHQSLFDQYQMYANLQMTTLNLLLEKRHESEKGLSPQYYVDLYVSGMEKQADIFLKRVEGMMALTFNHALSSNHPYKSDDWHAYENNAFVLLTSETRESETLVLADAIVGNALGRDQAVTLRLASYMWVDTPHNPSWLANVPVTLIDIDTGVEYAPDNVYRNRVNLPDTGAEHYNWAHQLWDINRYEFTSLPDGAYGIKNVNELYPNPKGLSFILIHHDYLNRHVVMEPGKFHNMLMGAYAYPNVMPNN